MSAVGLIDDSTDKYIIPDAVTGQATLISVRADEQVMLPGPFNQFKLLMMGDDKKHAVVHDLANDEMKTARCYLKRKIYDTTDGKQFVKYQAAQAGRLGSFLVIGDWGWDPLMHGNTKSVRCQRTIAEKMLETMRSLGDVKFIINVGDSFYPQGVSSKTDPQWDTKWRSIFHQELRSVPWYSVYGNHDFHKDPCACVADPRQCAQVNDDINNLNYFYMPSYNWFREHPELQLEVIGLDMNQFMWAWNKMAPLEKQCATDCFWTKCHADCEGNMRYRAQEALQLLRERSEKSTAKNLIVFSHYPTDYLTKLPQVMAHLSNASRHVEYFAGHRHNVDQASTASTAPNSNWLVGGGGGWSCDPVKGEEPKQGFVVGKIGLDHKLTTEAVLVDSTLCCWPLPPPGPPPPPPPPGTVPFCIKPGFF